jgi:hypothetical protein
MIVAEAVIEKELGVGRRRDGPWIISSRAKVLSVSIAARKAALTN